MKLPGIFSAELSTYQLHSFPVAFRLFFSRSCSIPKNKEVEINLNIIHLATGRSLRNAMGKQLLSRYVFLKILSFWSIFGPQKRGFQGSIVLLFSYLCIGMPLNHSA